MRIVLQSCNACVSVLGCVLGEGVNCTPQQEVRISKRGERDTTGYEPFDLGRRGESSFVCQLLSQTEVRHVQGYLAHKKLPPPLGPP